jgi:hypothetical protein
MKTLALTILALCCGAAMAAGSHSVKGYYKKDGTYVAPTRATNPNATKVDNYSSKGNFNPATGKAGKKDPYAIELSKPSRKK